MVFFIFLALFVVLSLLHFYLRNYEDAKTFSKIIGPPGLPIIGNALQFLGSSEKVFILARSLSKSYKDIYRVWMGPFRVINIYGPDDVEVVLSNSKYNTKSPLYDYLRPWLGDGLLLSFGKKWHSRRKILTPAFHFNVLKEFSVILEENSWKLVDRLQPEVHKDHTDIIPFITTFTLHSICETAMGTKLEEESVDTMNSYKSSIYEIGELLTFRALRPWLSPDWSFNTTAQGIKQKTLLKNLHNFTNRVIDERRSYLSKNLDQSFAQNPCDDVSAKKRMAMLDILLKAERERLIDRDGIREEVDTFMFEGHDTTSSALCYALLLLANNQQAQEQAYQECVHVFGADSDQPASMSDLAELKYLECCIKEALRLYPSVPLISRMLLNEVKLKDHIVPKGTWCHIQIYDLHRRPDIWPDPEAFKPERFTIENCTNRHPYAYVPFSAGPRNCIGQRFAMLELKSSLAAILRRYKLLPITKPEDVVLLTDLVLRSKTPIYVRFQTRQ